MDLRGQGAGERGYAMAALLVSIAVMGILMSVALPVWRHELQREKEAELIFRGEQYARAIALFQRKFAGAFPSSVDMLLDQKFLRKKYKDPMTEDGEFQVLYQVSTQPGQPAAGQGQPRPGASQNVQPPRQQESGVGGTQAVGPRGGIVGVVSKSKDASIRIYNGRTRYSEWQFVFTPATTRPGPVGPTTPQPGGQGPRSPQGSPGRPTGISPMPRPQGMPPGRP